MAKTPKVSVVTITYNHELFIRQALDSFVNQQTNFSFEVIVADDASTDATPDIIAEYALAYPHIFRPILRQRNIGAQNNSIDALRAARGVYIALCEGDDYWTDINKLQCQSDYLDAHPSCAVCFHPVRVIREGGTDDRNEVFPNPAEARTFTRKSLLDHNFIQTNSVMYRRQTYDALPSDILPLDWYLHLYHAQFGSIGFVPTVMAAYRRHPGGLWWESDKNVDIIWRRYGLQHARLYAEILKLYGSKKQYRAIVESSLFRLLDVLIDVDHTYKERIFAQVINVMPDLAEAFVQRKRDMLLVTIEKSEALMREVAELKQKNQSLGWHYEAIIKRKEQQLATITNSRFWRFKTKAAKFLGRP